MYAPKNNMNKNKSINRNNINLYNNNSACDNIYQEFNYNYFIYILLVISCLFNLIFITKNIKKQKNISIQTDPHIISLLINPDNNVQIMNYE